MHNLHPIKQMDNPEWKKTPKPTIKKQLEPFAASMKENHKNIMYKVPFRFKY